MSKVTTEEFVKVWQSSASVSQVVERTGLRLGVVRSRAGWLRRKGVSLKRYRHREDFQALAALADRLAPKKK